MPLRPLIDIALVHTGGSANVRVLVDSGSPYNLIDFPFSRRIGVDLDEDEWEPITIAGGTRRAVFATVSLVLPDFDPIRVPVGFIRDWEWPYGIVGQRGFFDQFLVTFDRPNLRFGLELVR